MAIVANPGKKVYDSELPCFRCGVLDYHRVEPGSGPHGSKLVCAHCGGFIRWLPTRTPEGREAAKREGIRRWMATQAPTPKQLRYLKRLGHTGARPDNRLRAHDAIDALKRARGWA